ncbi:MAG: F0F1 ATP synthase subunit A, partial [Lachnospiraceae bacterium]|nr:F0F1 ATP synthase subunit A [Lachnospiraceae bacterium]
SIIFGFVKVLDLVVRPMSLCLRLFGNILGGYIVMTLIYQAFPAIVPAVVGVYFDLFDGGLQAYVFIFLTMLYISEAVEPLEENA